MTAGLMAEEEEVAEAMAMAMAKRETWTLVEMTTTFSEK